MESSNTLSHFFDFPTNHEALFRYACWPPNSWDAHVMKWSNTGFTGMCGMINIFMDLGDSNWAPLSHTQDWYIMINIF